MGVTSRDVLWLRKAFLMATDGLDDQTISEFGYTDALARPYDTTPGGYDVMNPLPQFTAYADIRVSTKLIATAGIGRWYDEAYGQRQQKIYMRFGVPEFTPMTQFFTGFYSYQASMLARTGRASQSMVYWLGRLVGLAVTVFNIPLLVTTLVIGAYDFFTKKQSSKFYSFKPAMHIYWNTVTTLVNHYSVNRGIIPRMFTGADNQELAAYNNYTPADLASFAQAMEIFNANGQVDVYRYASLAFRRKRAFMKKLSEVMDNSGLSFAVLSSSFQNMINGQNAIQPEPGRDYKTYMTQWLQSPHGSPMTGTSTNSDGSISQGQAEGQVNTFPSPDNISTDRMGLWGLLTTELDDGTAFICLRVNSTGEVGESFSNTTAHSEIENKINDMSASSRNTSFNVAGGALSGAIGAAVGAVKDFAGGVMDQFSISGLAVLGGAAFVDIPERWDASSSSLAQQTYTMSLVSPYGNPISQLFNIYLPLFLIIAGALPRSTGKQSYTSPFLCQLFDKGKQTTRLGIIDSISVRRGTTNLPFNRHMQAMGLEVTFSVKDLSSIMHVPISEGFTLNPVKALFDEDNVYTDWMATIAGMDIDDQIYSFRKFALNVTKWASNWSSWTSASHIASFLGNGTPLRFVSMFYKGIEP